MKKNYINLWEIYEDIDIALEDIFSKNDLSSVDKSALQSLRENIVFNNYKYYYLNKVDYVYRPFISLFVVPLYQIYDFSKRDNIIIIDEDDRQEQQEIFRQLNYTPSKIIKKINPFKNFKTGITVLKHTLAVWKYVYKLPHIKKIFHKALFRQLTLFYMTYFGINMSGIKIIITANTAHRYLPAVMKRAEDLGITTIKIDYYITATKSTNSGRINAKYYFPLDPQHKKFYQKCKWNKDVIFLDGGRLCNDFLVEYKGKVKPNNTRKTIVFLTQSLEMQEDNEFYISLLAEFVSQHPEYRLIIKRHPADKKNYDNFICDNIELSTAQDRECFELLRNADYILAVFSSLIFQSKFINQNSYMLNFFNRNKLEVTGIFDLQCMYADYLEIINSKQMLFDVLIGKHKTTTCEYYIQNVNPNFGNTAQKFKEIVNNIKESDNCKK